MAASRTIEVKATNEIELLTKLKAIESILELPADQIKRLSTLSKSEKAKSYLSSEIKFATLKTFL